MNKLNLFNQSDISQSQFLKDYWHKKPLLFKSAINIEDLKVLPNKTKLIQLSCHEDIQSRVVFKQSEDEYSVEFGPFIENDFEEIEQDPKQNAWNLLVSDVDKWQPESRQILDYFNFIRNWIFDDIMLSCGSKGGTVGPHTDHYDVFLIQVTGQRQWSYGHNKIYNPDLKPDIDLKLMSNFKADEIHTLNPGDVLYIPPEVAHYGIAASDDCVTCSIGMRTPSHSELMTSFVDYLAQKKSDDDRFEEPQFNQPPQIGEIKQNDLDKISQILTDNLNNQNQSLNHWFGQYITEYRSLFFEFNQYQDPEDIDKTKDLKLSPFSKSCYFAQNQKADLYVNGQHYETSLVLAEFICNEKKVSPIIYDSLSKTDWEILLALFENGSLIQDS
ncbi:MAG: cupin domain-containing protein [Marinicellaceae bacterium]